jgi:hypothetical protein
MRKQWSLFIALVIILSLFLSSCDVLIGSVLDGVEETSPDIDATVDAAVLMTQEAEAALQATVDAKVQATLSAQSDQDTATPPAPEGLSEEDLATRVEDASNSTNESVKDIESATEEAASDDELSPEEIEELEELLEYAYDDLIYLLSLVDQYSYYFGDLAAETLELLILVEDDLIYLVALADQYSEQLILALEMIEDGTEVADEVMYELMATADLWTDKSALVTDQAGVWKTALLAELDGRAAKWLELVPSETAGTRLGALAQARDYVQTVRQSLVDGMLSREEMDRIGQLAANAASSLNSAGGVQLQGFAGSITDLTTNLAVGNLPQAQIGLSDLEISLPSRP